MNRRSFLLKAGGLGVVGAAGAYGYSTLRPIGLQRFSKRSDLLYPEQIDARESGQFAIQAQASFTPFVPNVQSSTLGFNQSYLGSVIRVNAKGTTKAAVSNKLAFPITSHWHGLIIPRVQDGGHISWLIVVKRGLQNLQSINMRP